MSAVPQDQEVQEMTSTSGRGDGTTEAGAPAEAPPPSRVAKVLSGSISGMAVSVALQASAAELFQWLSRPGCYSPPAVISPCIYVSSVLAVAQTEHTALRPSVLIQPLDVLRTTMQTNAAKSTAR